MSDSEPEPPATPSDGRILLFFLICFLVEAAFLVTFGHDPTVGFATPTTPDSPTVSVGP